MHHYVPTNCNCWFYTVGEQQRNRARELDAREIVRCCGQFVTDLCLFNLFSGLKKIVWEISSSSPASATYLLINPRIQPKRAASLQLLNFYYFISSLFVLGNFHFARVALVSIKPDSDKSKGKRNLWMWILISDITY